ncbi:MAG: cytochrome c oxidase subunit II [Bdellovibrionaceae bacterium]|nr:cytochrome c oxidase subunit II [Pseudobdellovibrionaceae bacterium]
MPVTDYVAQLKKLEDFLIIISFIACVLISFAFAYFAFKFRRKETHEQGHAKKHHNLPLELVWSFIPFVLFMIAFVWGWLVYKDVRNPPENSLEIQVYAQRWNWEFIYKNGRKTTKELYVPVNQPVKLIMTSRDVIHSFYIPSFKIKQDVVPGMYTYLWFSANHKGKFQVFCTEFCGTGHSTMGAKLNVVSLEDWENWLKSDPYKGLSLAEVGGKVFQGRCTACHRPTKQRLIGPGLAGIYNTQRDLEDGSSVLGDENYLRESILNPSAKISKGYPNQMTPFAGLLSEEELSGLIEYIKSLN